MTTTILTENFALFWGFFCITASLVISWNRKYFLSIIKNIFTHKKYSIFLGSCLVFAGLSHIYYHNTWDGNLEKVISLFGWATLLKGLLILFTFPHYLAMSSKIIESPILNLLLVFVLLGGIILIYSSLQLTF